MTPVRSNRPPERRAFVEQHSHFQAARQQHAPPLMREAAPQPLSLARRAYKRPGLIINPTTHMAWRPYENLIDGELDNRVPGKVSGWMRFCRSGNTPLKVTFDLAGDFHEDICGKVIRLSNPKPLDRNADLRRRGTYMEGFASVQRGEVGDITAGLSLGKWTDELSQKLLLKHEAFWEQTGVPASERKVRRQELAGIYRERVEQHELFYPYVSYPYIEWYTESNGRVVLELDPSQVEILGDIGPWQRIPDQSDLPERSVPPQLLKLAADAGLVPLRESSRRDASTPEADSVN